MSTAKVTPIRLSPTERHKYVALGVKAGKTNRAIAKELGVDEGTVRQDRKFLATPENKRPVRMPLPKKPKKERPVRELSPEEIRRQYLQDMLTVVQLWIIQEGIILPDLEVVILPTAGKLLYQHRDQVSRIPEPVESSDELLSLTRPSYAVEDYIPAKLEFYGAWLARCLPREEELQDEMLRQISIWARSSESGFVY